METNHIIELEDGSEIETSVSDKGIYLWVYGRVDDSVSSYVTIPLLKAEELRDKLSSLIDILKNSDQTNAKT